MKTWTKQKIFTYIVFFVLLVIRLAVAVPGSLLEQLFNLSISSTQTEHFRLFQGQSLHFLYTYSLILVAIVIIVNRSNLKSLNIDKGFILIFLCSGLAYDWNLGWRFGLATALISVSVSILSVKGWLKFGDTEPNLLRMMLVIVIGFFLGVLFINDFTNPKIISWIFQDFLMFIPLVVVEEVIFRGLLWMFLKDLNFSEFKIVILQAILFWFSHAYYAYSNPVLFWIIVPIVSFLLGIIVWRSRSITPSVTAHILFNLSLGLVAYKNL